MIVLIVIATAVVVTVMLVIASRLGFAQAVPLDTEAEERWLLRHTPPRIRPFAEYVDRRVAGGIAVAAAFATLFGGALVMGWLLDSIDGRRGFARWDESVARWGAEHATHRSTSVLEAITNLGASRWMLVVMILVGFSQVRRRGWEPIVYLAVVGVGASALNNGLKALVHRERPNVSQLVRFVGTSFPSGHSAMAAAGWAAVASVLCARSPRSIRLFSSVLAIFIAVAVAASRVLLGVHWLTDVMAGLMVGWTWFLLCTIAFGGRLLRLGEPVERIARA